jgi:hypothetical protein
MPETMIPTGRRRRLRAPAADKDLVHIGDAPTALGRRSRLRGSLCEVRRIKGRGLAQPCGSDVTGQLIPRHNGSGLNTSQRSPICVSTLRSIWRSPAQSSTLATSTNKAAALLTKAGSFSTWSPQVLDLAPRLCREIAGTCSNPKAVRAIPQMGCAVSHD